MKLSEFNYVLPEELIAQYPLEDRSQANLLVLEKKTSRISHCKFYEISKFLEKGDALVINNTRVFRARLKGKKETGGSVELLLIKQTDQGLWEALVSHSRRVRVNTKILLSKDMYATVREKAGSRCLLEFNVSASRVIEKYGIVPLPHYIKRNAVERDQAYYQSIFAKKQGSIAAPTAGLHFTNVILEEIKARGAKIIEITLHIGPGTFKPIRTDNIEAHIMEAEDFEITEDAVKIIKGARRIFGVGTSVCRALETFANTKKKSGSADLFIHPGYKFKLVDCLITNFHLPCSTPLLLVCAFAGKNRIFKAYREAMRKKYRFLSYGDATLIV